MVFGLLVGHLKMSYWALGQRERLNFDIFNFNDTLTQKLKENAESKEKADTVMRSFSLNPEHPSLEENKRGGGGGGCVCVCGGNSLKRQSFRARLD